MHMRRLADLVRPEWRAMSVSMATLAVTTGISLVFPAAIGQVLDASLLVDAVAGGDGGARFGGPTVVAGGLIALFAVQSALVVLRGALLSVSGERMAARLRKELFRAVLSQEVAWFDGQRAGDLTNRLSADAAVVQKALSTNIAYGLRSVGMVAGGTAALVAISPSLAALSLGLIPPVALGGMAYGRYLQTQQAAVQAALGRSMAVAEETVSNVRTVRATLCTHGSCPTRLIF
jgi:ABC-type multidrug transport system fused ATPase/permease subunit